MVITSILLTSGFMIAICAVSGCLRPLPVGEQSYV
jgi:hypothetical protein